MVPDWNSVLCRIIVRGESVREGESYECKLCQKKFTLTPELLGSKRNKEDGPRNPAHLRMFFVGLEHHLRTCGSTGSAKKKGPGRPKKEVKAKKQPGVIKMKKDGSGPKKCGGWNKGLKKIDGRYPGVGGPGSGLVG